jgi:hypothetical protein
MDPLADALCYAAQWLKSSMVTFAKLTFYARGG